MKKRNMILAGLVLCALHATQSRAAETGDLPFFPSMPKLEYAFDAALMADMLTTADIHNHPPLIETNPILGQHPSAGKIAAYGAGVAVFHALITYELVSQGVPSPIVTAWEAVSIGVELGYTGHNLSLGCKLRF